MVSTTRMVSDDTEREQIYLQRRRHGHPVRRLSRCVAGELEVNRVGAEDDAKGFAAVGIVLVGALP
jgi:hypothetical protein